MSMANSTRRCGYLIEVEFFIISCTVRQYLYLATDRPELCRGAGRYTLSEPIYPILHTPFLLSPNEIILDYSLSGLFTQFLKQQILYNMNSQVQS